MSTIDRLQNARSAISQDGNQWFTTGPWISLYGELALRSGSTASDLRRVLSATTWRQWSLWTTIAKLEWMLEMRDSGSLDPFAWSAFAEVDLIAYHTSLRAIFDDLVKALDVLATKRGQLPNSFRKLRYWLERPEGRVRIDELLGKGITTAIENSPDWFARFRGVRDLIVHSGAHSLVFPKEPGIIFQVYSGLKPVVTEPAVMVGDNVADFRRYAAIQMADLTAFQNDLAQAIAQQQGFSLSPGLSTTVHFGLETLGSWLDHTIAALEP